MAQQLKATVALAEMFSSQPPYQEASNYPQFQFQFPVI